VSLAGEGSLAEDVQRFWRTAWQPWARRGYFSPDFKGSPAQKASAVSGNQLYLRADRMKYRYLSMQFKGDSTCTKAGINSN